jgi:Fe-Mn family superoxide dismutase
MHKLPELSYARDALMPHLSEESFDFHYGKHHAAYVSKLNDLLADHEWSNLPLEQLVVASAKTPSAKAIFNNAAQHWNHSFFWASMKPQGGGKIPPPLEERLNKRFGQVETFMRDFVAAGSAQFGSGWVWLVEKNGELDITTTANADNPLTQGARALLVCDVWEHAYYLDYRNARPQFLSRFINHLVDWGEASRRLFAKP